MTVKEKKPVFPPGMVGHIPPRVERGQAVSAKAPRGACEKCSGQGLVLVPTYDAVDGVRKIPCPECGGEE